jgi:L-lactate dehydrogenase
VKIGIVGAGQVGATAAYAMMMRSVGSEIVLVDRNADLAVAQARDILDATPLADPVRVRAGESADLDDARVVVLAAGANQRPGESRLDLLSRNAEIIGEIVPAVLAVTDPIFLVATNPLDVMTQIVTMLAGRMGVAPERVIGSGTILDSARFRTQLAVHLGISPTYIDARVLGEHGDSAVLHWSGAVAGNLPVAEVARQMGRELTKADRNRIDTAVRGAAYAIIQGKGATWFGVGAGLTLPPWRRLMRILSSMVRPPHTLRVPFDARSQTTTARVNFAWLDRCFGPRPSASTAPQADHSALDFSN